MSECKLVAYFGKRRVVIAKLPSVDEELAAQLFAAAGKYILGLLHPRKMPNWPSPKRPEV